MARRLFLERRTYRQNRLQDAARLLPVLGIILLFGPIFIRDDPATVGLDGAPALSGTPTLAGGLVYYFAVWLGLIVLTALVSRAMASGPVPEVEGEAGTPIMPTPVGRSTESMPVRREVEAAPVRREVEAAPVRREDP